MKEEFLFYIWRYLKFDLKNLETTSNEKITIHNVGLLNQDGGPDFNHAQISIDDTLWNGRIEIHTNASDWYAHNHHSDYKYDNVILHVVYIYDKPVYRSTGEPIPTLELKGRIPRLHIDQYEKLIFNHQWIPCSGQILSAPQITIDMWLERLFVERIESKAKTIRETWLKTEKNWEETLYICLASGFGLRINAEPFIQLAQSLPIRFIQKSSYDITIIEALVFGQSGLLNTESKDDYVQVLAKEYDYQRRKLKLTPLKSDTWQWFRLRPASFPSIRLAQWSQFIVQNQGMFSKILNETSTKNIIKFFEVTASNYWDTHYVFGKKSNHRLKKFSKSSIHLLIINILAPLIFLYGKEKQEQKYIDHSYKLLTDLPPEKNNIISKWKKHGIEATTAFKTQALLQLYNQYCKKKKCLDCSIGHCILKEQPSASIQNMPSAS